MKLKTYLVIGTLLLSVAGCKSAKQGTTNGTQATAPVTSSWETFYTANPATQNDAVKSILPITSGTITGTLVGHTTGPIYFVDQNGQASLEGSFNNISKLVQTSNGRIFASTAEPFFTGINGVDGQVYERTASGWQLSLDHPLGGAVVAALDSEVYCFASQFAVASNSTVSILSGASQTWQQDVASIGSMHVVSATTHNGQIWVGGSENNTTRAAPMLIHGVGTAWVDVALPNVPGNNEIQMVTDMVSADGNLYLALIYIDTLGPQALVTGGEVLATVDDGNTWDSLITFTAGEAPISVGWFDGGLQVGTILGRLYHDQLGVLVEDTAFPTNAGVFTFAVDGATLLAGVRGISGAEMYRLGTSNGTTTPTPAPLPQPSPSTSPSPAPAPALTYQDIKPILTSGNCAICHADPNNAGYAVFMLSSGLSDDTADYAATQMEIDTATPDNSKLLQKISGAVAHVGGAPYPSTSAEYMTIREWISAQAPFN